MSDLFKDQRPELSDDEDRRLWQRVRAVPDEVAATPKRELATARAPWWRALWAMPAVRYGAPALAVLLVAVVWVVEQRPTPPARKAAEHAVTSRVFTGSPVKELPTPQATEAPAPTRARVEDKRANEASLRAQTERAQVGAAKDEIVVQETAPAPPADASRLKVAKPRESAAAPAPQERQPAPAPVPTSANQTFATPPKSADSTAPVAPQASAPSPNTWGSVRSGYRDSGPSTHGGRADELKLGGLSNPADLARHEIVANALDVPALGPIEFWGALPRGTDWGPDSKAWVHVVADGDGPPRVTFVPSRKSLRQLMPGEEYEYEAAPPRVQAALLAALFERALLDPGAVPRRRIEELLEAARRVERRGGAGQGAGALVRTLETALESWPGTTR